MDPNKIRRLPALLEYLRSQPVLSSLPKPDYRRQWISGLIAFGAVGVLTAGFGWAASLFSAAVAGLTVGLGPSWLGAEVGRPSRFEGLPSLRARLLGICERKRVHRELDPGAAIALESCARSYLDIRQRLTSEFWNPSRLDDNWRRMRSDSLERAEDAMEEAIYLCRSWVGHSRKKRKSAWKEALGEILEGDFDDVIEAFSERKEEEWESGSPPVKPAGFALDPVRKIGVQLRQLARELEEAQSVFAAPNDAVPAETELQKTLQNLRELKQAEAELNDAVQLRLKR